MTWHDIKDLEKQHRAKLDSGRQPRTLGTRDSCWAHVWITGPDTVTLTRKGVAHPQLQHSLFEAVVWTFGSHPLTPLSAKIWVITWQLNGHCCGRQSGEGQFQPQARALPALVASVHTVTQQCCRGQVRCQGAYCSSHYFVWIFLPMETKEKYFTARY